MAFWKAHRDAAVKGKISAKGVAASYTQVTSENDVEAVTVCYEDSAVTVREKAHFVFAGAPDACLYLDVTDNTPRRVRVLDAAWQVVSEQTLAGKGVYKLEMPAGGSAEILPVK